MSIGVSYFGNRILRHVASDMMDLADRGFTGVLHTFSENDFNYYHDQMKRIVEVSRTCYRHDRFTVYQQLADH